jgi:hypothetical protein
MRTTILRATGCALIASVVACGGSDGSGAPGPSDDSGMSSGSGGSNGSSGSNGSGGSSGSSGSSGSGGSSGSASSSGVSCFRAVRCRATCGGPILQQGCGPCPTGTIDDLYCTADSGTGDTGAGDTGADASSSDTYPKCVYPDGSTRAQCASAALSCVWNGSCDPGPGGPPPNCGYVCVDCTMPTFQTQTACGALDAGSSRD